MVVQEIFIVFVSYVVTICNEPEYLDEYTPNFAALGYFMYVYLLTKFYWV